MILFLLRWAATLAAAFLAGKLASRVRLPAILGWLIAGMLLGPHAAGLLPQAVLDEAWYRTTIMWMQCAFGIMLGSELIGRKLKRSGKALLVTTLTQSMGTFLLVSAAFALVFARAGIPLYLAFAFGGIALATAPAPALSIVNEFHARGPVTDTLLPMTVLDDVVGIAVFFTVNSLVARAASGGAVPLFMIPVMIFLPLLIGVSVGVPAGLLLRRAKKRSATLAVLLAGITAVMGAGWLINTSLLSGVSLNDMLMGVAFAAAFSNLIPSERLQEVTACFSPILSVCLLAAIVDLGAPLDIRLILGAGVYTFVYIAARALGKYFGARGGAKLTHMPKAVQKYLGLTLLPHSGVSLVFTGILCSTLASEPALVQLVQGTIAAAAVLNEILAVLAAKKGFELAGEIR